MKPKDDEARIGRHRFDDRGDLYEESSFAIETELQGF